MKQQKIQAILVYGTSQKNNTQELTKVPVIDVLDPGWYDNLSEIADPSTTSIFFCMATAYITARKRIPSNLLVKINHPDEISTESTSSGPKIAAARIGDVAISKGIQPVVLRSGTWLSTYHLDLIQELFTQGYIIEILDEYDNLVTTIGE